MKKNIDYSFYLITDENISHKKLLNIIDLSFKGNYATILQLRIKKNISYDNFYKIAIDIKKITDEYNIPLIINDNVNIANDIDCEGIHIGQNDMNLLDARKILSNDKIIGVSVSTVEEAILAEKNGANYLGIGSIFDTKTKIDAKHVSVELLRDIIKHINIPSVAIGGITENNISNLYGLGLSGVAFISEVMNSTDINKKLHNLKKKI